MKLQLRRGGATADHRAGALPAASFLLLPRWSASSERRELLLLERESERKNGKGMRELVYILPLLEPVGSFDPWSDPLQWLPRPIPTLLCCLSAMHTLVSLRFLLIFAIFTPACLKFSMKNS
jgi:hypothetical protein